MQTLSIFVTYFDENNISCYVSQYACHVSQYIIEWLSPVVTALAKKSNFCGDRFFAVMSRYGSAVVAFCGALDKKRKQ